MSANVILLPDAFDVDAARVECAEKTFVSTPDVQWVSFTCFRMVLTVTAALVL